MMQFTYEMKYLMAVLGSGGTVVPLHGRLDEQVDVLAGRADRRWLANLVGARDLDVIDYDNGVGGHDRGSNLVYHGQ
jgi:hypothetical protein